MKDIKNYEGLYAVTSCGKVWSYKSKRFLKSSIKKTGYCVVTLCKDGAKKECLVHRLVAEAYIPNEKNKPQVSHLDETRTNNNINNLCWVDARENCNMPEHIKRKSKSLLNNAASKKVLCIETGVTYPSMSEAARQFSCTPQNIRSACINGFKACGYHWRYI